MMNKHNKNIIKYYTILYILNNTDMDTMNKNSCIEAKQYNWYKDILCKWCIARKCPERKYSWTRARKREWTRKCT